MDWTLIADIGRWAAVAFFALFVGGAALIHVHYRQKNLAWKNLTGRPRPMYKHVVYVSLGALLASISAITNNFERLGEGMSVYVPLNLLAFWFLWRAMNCMLKETHSKEGWLRYDDGSPASEAKIAVEQVIGNKATEK